MSVNFLHNFQQEDIKRTKDDWIVTISAAKLELNLLTTISNALTTIDPALCIINQSTAVNERNWKNHATLPAAEQLSRVTTVQWQIRANQPLTANSLHESVNNSLDANTLKSVDVNVMPLTTMIRPHKLALFDMDSTLIEQEVIVELAKYAGIGEQVNQITETAMRGEIDFVESFTRRVALLEGLSSSILDEIIKKHITFSLGAKRLVQALKHNGYHVVLVSGGFNYFAEYVKQQLGIDEIYANDLDIINGKVTGKVMSPIVDGNRKAQILTEVTNRLGLDLSQTVAVGDGANDLPMLGLADIGIAYHAKPIVSAQADYTINVTGLDGIIALLGLDNTL